MTAVFFAQILYTHMRKHLPHYPGLFPQYYEKRPQRKMVYFLGYYDTGGL